MKILSTALIAFALIVLAIAMQTQRKISAGTYAWRNFYLISIGWLVLILPGIRSFCINGSCKWSVSFTWWIRPLYDFLPLDRLSPVAILTIAGVIAFAATVYFVGHVLGWAVFGVRRLFRLA